MIKKVVLGATLTAMSVFGFEVEDKKVFWTKTAPNEMSARMTFSVSRPSQMEAKMSLDALLSEAKTKTTVCKGGEYYIFPKSEYDQATKTVLVKGYEGNIGFSCRFTNVTFYDDFVRYLESKIKNPQTEKLSMYPISWELTGEQREAGVEKLKFTALDYSSKRAAELSRVTKSMCELKKITFGSEDKRLFRVGMKAMAAESSGTESPIPEAEYVSIDTDMIFDCKRP